MAVLQALSRSNYLTVRRSSSSDARISASLENSSERSVRCLHPPQRLFVVLVRWICQRMARMRSRLDALDPEEIKSEWAVLETTFRRAKFADRNGLYTVKYQSFMRKQTRYNAWRGGRRLYSTQCSQILIFHVQDRGITDNLQKCSGEQSVE